jgi:serine/threonine protein kinase
MAPLSDDAAANLAPTVAPDHERAGPAEPEFARGEIIGDRYLVQHYISGGMNDIYLCIERGLRNRQVALKFPKPGRGALTGAAQRQIFFDEARNWAELRQHPNVANCLYIGWHGDRFFLVLEWVGAPDQPRDIGALPTRQEASDPGEWENQIIKVAHDICDGLSYIHKRGLTHGDLKPSNILLSKDGRAKITDLGIALKSAVPPKSPLRWRRSATARHRTESLRGTYLYMAPELWVGQPAGVKTDIYALGCVLYELATGHPPFEAPDEAELEDLHRKQPPPLIRGVSDNLRRLISECLAKSPKRRPASAGQIRDRLDHMFPAAGDEQSAPAPAEGETTDDWAPGYGREIEHMTLTLAAGKHEDAIEELSAALRTAMKSWLTDAARPFSGGESLSLAWLFNDRGYLVAMNGDVIAASLDFISAIRLDRSFSAAYANLGTCHQKLDLPTLALTSFNRAIDLDPEDHRFWLKRARLLRARGWDAAAHADYERALSLAPDDAQTCWGMADSLFALGREEEAAAYREKSRTRGGTGEVVDWLRPSRVSRKGNLMAGATKSLANDDEAAIRFYTAALAYSSLDINAHYQRAESYLAIGEYSKAVKDLDIFLDLAPTTHGLVQAAERMRLEALEETGPTGGDHSRKNPKAHPFVKSPSYVAQRVGRRLCTEELMNWLPITARQRATLFDMLCSGDPDRRFKAERLTWDAFDDHLDRRASQYRDMISQPLSETATQTAFRFAECELWGDMAIRNGLGVPVLLTEAQLSHDSIATLQYLNTTPPSLGWYSSRIAGIWNVAPAFEKDRQPLHEEARAIAISPDCSGYVVVRGNALAVLPPGEPEAGDEVSGWELDRQYPPIVSACMQSSDGVALGLLGGSLVLLSTSMEPQYIRLTESEEDRVHVRQGAGRDIYAFSGGVFYRIASPAGEGKHSQAESLATTERLAVHKLLAFDGLRAIFALPEEELAVMDLSSSDEPVVLRPRDSTDTDGFSAAAISRDGTVIAAVCGSFLHVWTRPEPNSPFICLPITRQTYAKCMTMSPEGSYIAVGTAAGSIAIFRLGIEEG